MVQIEEVLEIGGDHLLEDLVVGERIVQEVVELVFEVEKILKEEAKRGSKNWCDFTLSLILNTK